MRLGSGRGLAVPSPDILSLAPLPDKKLWRCWEPDNWLVTASARSAAPRSRTARSSLPRSRNSASRSASSALNPMTARGCPHGSLSAYPTYPTTGCAGVSPMPWSALQRSQADSRRAAARSARATSSGSRIFSIPLSKSLCPASDRTSPSAASAACASIETTPVKITRANCVPSPAGTVPPAHRTSSTLSIDAARCLAPPPRHAPRREPYSERCCGMPASRARTSVSR
jgi:hypothetical protein